jgi:hypothetical protein
MEGMNWSPCDDDMDELGVSEDTFNNVEQAFDIRSLT